MGSTQKNPARNLVPVPKWKETALVNVSRKTLKVFQRKLNKGGNIVRMGFM